MSSLRESEDALRGLLLAARGGDEVAYRAFLARLAAHLRAFYRKRLRGLPDEVEDLVQEALLAVHTRRHTYESDQPLTAWVHAIAHYKMVDMFRRRSMREVLHEPWDECAELFVAADEAGAVDAKRDVGRLLETLPDRWRLPIQYVKLDGLSVVEAAKKAGMSESAVKVGVHRGLRALAAAMRADEDRRESR